MEYGDFLVFLFTVLIVVALLGFTFYIGWVFSSQFSKVKQRLKGKAGKKKVGKKQKVEKEVVKGSRDGLCRLPDGYVGLLKDSFKDLPASKPYSEVCRFADPFECSYFFQCIGVEKKK